MAGLLENKANLNSSFSWSWSLSWAWQKKIYLDDQQNPEKTKIENNREVKERSCCYQSPRDESVNERKRTKEKLQNKTHRLFIDHHAYCHYECGIEVNENISIDIEDGGMILEEEDSKTVTNYNRKNHKNNLKHNKIVIVVYGRKLLLYLSRSDTRLRPFI